MRWVYMRKSHFQCTYDILYRFNVLKYNEIIDIVDKIILYIFISINVLQSDNCVINMYIYMWKLWIKNIYVPKKEINKKIKKVHWNIGLGYECVYLFIYFMSL
jgi:hypothetical protein